MPRPWTVCASTSFFPCPHSFSSFLSVPFCTFFLFLFVLCLSINSTIKKSSTRYPSSPRLQLGTCTHTQPKVAMAPVVDRKPQSGDSKLSQEMQTSGPACPQRRTWRYVPAVIMSTLVRKRRPHLISLPPPIVLGRKDWSQGIVLPLNDPSPWFFFYPLHSRLFRSQHRSG